MYVCICNAVTEDDVRGCMAHGTEATARAIKVACGMKPGCGSCTRRLHSLISEYRTAAELVDAVTGGPLPFTAVPDDAPATGVPATEVPGTAVPAARASSTAA